MPGNPLVRFDEGRVGRTAKVSPSLLLYRLCVRIVFEPVDNARDAVFDQGHLEVDEQAKTLVGEPEIGQKLFLVDRGQQLHGFDFHDDLVFNDQVCPEAGVDADILIDHRDRLLARRAETPATQFIR